MVIKLKAHADKFRRKILCSVKVCIGLVLLFNGHSVLSAEQSDKGLLLPGVHLKEISEGEKERLRIAAEIKAHQKLVDGLIYRTSAIPSLIKQGEVKKHEIPNPHWSADRCIACHTNDSEYADKNNIRTKNIDKSCMNCHSAEFDHSYIHPVDIRPSADKLAVMATGMKNQILNNKGKVGCSTCHDISLQCRMENRQKHENRRFFRKGPYMNRYDLCNKCHQPEKYKRFNPHEHVSAEGKIIKEKCRVCHSGSVEKLLEATSAKDITFHTEKDLKAICWGCHQWKPHPGGQFSFFKSVKGPDHLVKPSQAILENIETTLKDKGVVMPLEPGTNRVYCATCHNPHAKGIIKNPAAAKGAGSEKRLRSKKLCINCHSK